MKNRFDFCNKKKKQNSKIFVITTFTNVAGWRLLVSKTCTREVRSCVGKPLINLFTAFVDIHSETTPAPHDNKTGIEFGSLVYVTRMTQTE